MIHTRRGNPTACLVLLLCAVGCAVAPTGRRLQLPPPPPAVHYFQLLHDGTDRARAQMPKMIESADAAAARFVRTGRIFVAGSQPDFARELIGRAGGLQAMKPLPERADQVERDDVVLYAARSALTQNDYLRISRLRERGAYVIAFASARLSDLRYFPPDVLIDSGDAAGIPLDGGRIVPTDTTLNLLNGWTWTGEFVAACTRLGRMPVIIQADQTAGGRERGMWYAGSTFHPDRAVPPIATGVLGMAYLDHIEQYLTSVSQESAEPLRVAAGWMRDATPPRSSAQFIAAIFPEHFGDFRAPQPFGSVKGVEARMPEPLQASLVIGYSDGPQLAVDASHLHRSKLLYTSVRRARDDRADYILYVHPYWPIEDACVPVSGYDIPILPASGVMESAIYWALVAEIYPPPKLPPSAE